MSDVFGRLIEKTTQIDKRLMLREVSLDVLGLLMVSKTEVESECYNKVIDILNLKIDELREEEGE